MQAFTVRIRPSRLWPAAVVLAHAASFALCAACFDGVLRIAGLAALALSLAHGLRTASPNRQAVREIRIDTRGRASLLLRGEVQEAELLDDSLIHPYVCFLKWRAGGKTFRQCLPADAADSEAYRRLSVWARYGQPKQETR